MGDAGALGFGLLGPLEVRAGNGATVDVGPAKQRAILAILLLRRGHVVPTDALVDLLWDGEPPATAVATLHGYIAGLRRAIGPGVVVTRSPGYVADVPDEAVDAARFTRLHAEGRAALADGRAAEAAAHLRAALDLWRGPALGDLAGEPFARAEATALDEARVAALDTWARAELDLGHHAEVVGALERAVAEAPLREDLRARLMVALYRTGRQAEALRTFATGRAVLADEVGIDPGPELVALEAAILAQDPALAWTPPTAGPPAAAPPTTRPPTATPVTTPDLVGRDDERADVLADLDAALGGHGRVVLVAGEPGIGKTRLAQEIARHGADRGATVVWGRCLEGRGAPALWPWTQVLDALVERSGPDVTATALGPAGAAVGALSPAVAALAGDEVGPPPLDAESARFRAFDAAARFVAGLARSRPVVVVLDDIQWADVASLGLLGHLATTVADAPVLVACTFRTVAPGVGDDLASLLADLARLPHSRRVDLEGLGRADVGRMLEAAPGGDALDLDAVIERTRGNPFFLGELVRWAGGDDGSRRVPSAVGDVVRARAHRLPDATATALADAAILGTRLEAELLAAVLDLDPTELLDLLSPALEAGLLAPDGRAGRWRYSHGLVSETLAGDLDPARRARLHRRAAEALTARHGEVDGPHLVAVADHLVQAIPAVSRAEAVDAAVRASAWAQAHLAHEQAEDQLRTAQALIEDMPAGPARDARYLEVQDHHHLGRLLVATVGFGPDALRGAAAHMSALCDRLDPDSAQLVPALWRLANLQLVRMELASAHELGERLLARAEASGDPGARLVAHIVLGAVHTYRAELPTGRAHLDAALALVRADPDLLVADLVIETGPVCTLAYSAWNHWALGDGERAEAEVREAVDLGVAHGRQSYAHAFALWFGGLVAALRGDAGTAIARNDEGIEAATSIGVGPFVPYMAVNRGWARAQRGDPDGGLAEVREAVATIEASGARMHGPLFAGAVADAHLRAGRPAEAAAAARRGLDEVEATGERWFAPELHRLLAAAEAPD
jgi:DNA-binding SARP family transcriptional activator